jgi:hypothetical protein
MGKISLQLIIEEILLKNNLSPSTESYYLKLRMPSHDESLVIGRVSEQILAGFQNKDGISNPVLAFDYNQGNWFPVSIEQPFGVTVCSFIEDGNLMAFPYRLKRCMLFQGMLANKIREQNYLEKGVKVE